MIRWWLSHRIRDGQADGDTYLVSSRGGDTDQLTTIYDSGSSADTDVLIVTGTPTDVAGNGPWLWSCVGAGGGVSASCSASRKVRSS